MNYQVNNMLSSDYRGATPVIGVTGGIGSGKTVLTDYLQSLNIQVIDADLVSREVVLPNSFGLNEIIKYFGPEILLPTETLNRAKLREIIFSNNESKRWLENLLHPLIAQNIQAKLKAATSQYIVLSSPLLFETKQDAYVDSSILVTVPTDIQVARARQRDNNSSEQIKAIIASQMAGSDKIKLADWVISNAGTIDEFHHSTQELHQQIMKFYRLI